MLSDKGLLALAVVLVLAVGIADGLPPSEPNLPPPIYMQFNYSTSASPLCVTCPNATKNAERYICSANPDFTWDTLRQFSDPIPSGHILYKIKFDIWGRFLCSGNETHLLLMLMTDFLVDQTFTENNATRGCTCGNCVFKYSQETPVILENSNYLYGGLNFLQPYVPFGSVCLSEVEMFMYYVPRPPDLTSLSPRGGPISGNTVVTVLGKNFSPASKLVCRFGDTVVPGNFVSATTVLCLTPSNMTTTETVLSVAVSNDGGGWWSNTSLLFYVYRDPVVSYITPKTGRISAAGSMITAVGSNFVQHPDFDLQFVCVFGNIVTPNATVQDDQHLQCMIPAGAAVGSVPFSISLNGQQFVSSNNCTFTFVADTDNLPFILWLSVAGGVLVIVVVLIIIKFVRSRNSSNSGSSHGSLNGQLFEKQGLLTKAGEPDYFDKEIDIQEIKMGQRIGKGSFGEVYLGIWQGTTIAVKKLPAHKVTDEFLREFAREAKIMKSLRHPNVILFLGACTDLPDICIITEYMNLGSLYNLIHDKNVQMSWSRVKKIAVDAAKGMAYLHYRNPAIIHRDLKSHNLLVDENWKVKVCDFGLSRIYGDTQAPEILRNSHYTTKADVYSFGIVLWELVTREEPFAGMPPFQVIFAVGTKGARPDLPTYCPPELTKLITMCWSEDPALRPTFNEILEYLDICDFGESAPSSVASSLSQSVGSSIPMSLPDKMM